ncbi:MAG: cupin domain-containing protein [Acidimicrobiales bacterium]
MTKPDLPTIPTVSMADVAPNRRRGGDIRTVLSPATVGCTAGFMGTLTLEPGEAVTEHWHPYSEESMFCVDGEVIARLDGAPVTLAAGTGLVIPIGVRHRIENHGSESSFLVFHLGPLAPRPDLGHVDTEEPPGAGA